MKNIKDIALIIFARLNSQRIFEKMIKSFAGTTLLDILFEKLIKSDIMPKGNIYLFAHEKELRDIAEKYNISILKRSEKSANAESDLKVIHEWYNKLDYKYVVSVNACVPFLSIRSIDDFIKHYINSEYEGLFGVINKRNLFWDTSMNLITGTPKEKHAPNTKTATEVYEAAHCLYASKISWIEEGKWLGTFKKPNDPELYVINESECFDIDKPWQFDFAEIVYKKQFLIE